MQNANHAYVLHAPSKVMASSGRTYGLHKFDIFLGFDKKATPEGIAIFKELPEYICRQMGGLQAPPVNSGYFLYKVDGNTASMEDCYPKIYLKREIGYLCYQIEFWTTEYVESKGADTILPPAKMLKSRIGYFRNVGIDPAKPISTSDLKEALSRGIKLGEEKYCASAI